MMLTNKNTPPKQKLSEIIRVPAVTPDTDVTPFTTVLFTIGLGLGLGLQLELT